MNGACGEATVALCLADMHCHLDRMTNAEEVARDAAAAGIAIFDTTVTPRDARAARARFAPQGNVVVGVGLHPWWLADGRCGDADVADLAALAATAPFIGEVGLDFGPKHHASKDVQVDAFEHLCAAIAAHPLPCRVLSIHAVRAAGCALDVLEAHGLLGRDDVTCIFHWFSGTSDELARARRAGCRFSVNEHMLRTKRGREYARQLPVDRLLLETDAPPGLDAPYSAVELEASLTRTLEAIAEMRAIPVCELATHIAATSQHLLGLKGA